MNNDKTIQHAKRIDWIDVSKAIAIFFIFCGHWKTKNGNLETFAYSFHLQLFFIISGFFAVREQKKKVTDFLKNKFFSLLIPFVFFTIINILYFDLDGNKKANELISNFITSFTDSSNTVSPQLWFLACLFFVEIFYYFERKLIKHPIVIAGIAFFFYIIYMCFTGNPIGIILAPFNIKFMHIWEIPRYLFWYSLGDIAFNKLNSFALVLNSERSREKTILQITGIFSTLFSCAIYLFKPERFWNKIIFLLPNKPLPHEIFNVLITLVICCAVMFLSVYLQSVSFLKYLGKNTLILMGFEFMVKDFVVLQFIPIFNVGIIKMDSTVQVISVVCITIAAIVPIANFLNNHLPYLVGKRSKSETVVMSTCLPRR